MREKTPRPEGSEGGAPVAGASPTGPSAPLWRRLHRAVRHSAFGRAWERGTDLELMHRAMGFAALGFLTLVPLLIVVAAADLAHSQGFAEWLGEGLGVSATAQDAVEDLFARPRQALATTTSFGLAALAVFGLSFGLAVQTGYEKVWELPGARWHTMWRHLVWLAALLGFLFLSAQLTRGGSRSGQDLLPSFWRLTVAMLAAVLFFWWSQRMLLAGRVGWAALLPGAVATVLGLAGLRVFSRLVFSPLIASNTVSYGPIGTVLVLQSWLVGVGFVVFGGALVGRLLSEDYPRYLRSQQAWRWRARRRRQQRRRARK
ncbi:YhjD/YihY/BrkB family envelope integrity protein [Streptomyces pathocidini]|uniref:YhjD/YihY/BrkB family envelope integrity protein n=1 Tax=Streptomyces pathocidini TaxID=1650571 RepID=A0ABW7UJH8_9ACTN|nr:YhjD/YihY/BrkB family envelope integrity protein [Streptomyces pathocidini]